MSSEWHSQRVADKQHESNLLQAHARTEVLREQLDRCLLLLAKRSEEYRQSKTLVQSLEEERVRVRLLEQEASHLGTECEALQSEATERRDENGVLRLQIIQIEHDKGSSESKLQRELQHCVASNETLRVQLDETRGKLQSKEEGEHRLRNEYRSTMLREEERSAELEARNRRLETKMRRLRCEQKSLQTNYSQAQTSMDELLASIMNLKRNKAQLEEEAKTSHKFQSLVHETIHEQEAKLKELKQSNASLKKEVAQSNRARRGANESIVKLVSRIKGMKNTTAGLKVDRRGLETELYGLQETVDHMILHC
jgi:chromosome segregation ATPase